MENLAFKLSSKNYEASLELLNLKENKFFITSLIKTIIILRLFLSVANYYSFLFLLYINQPHNF